MLTRVKKSLLVVPVVLALVSAGCSNKGVEINKEASSVFNSKTDQPVAVGGDSGVNKGKKPAGK